MLNSTFHMADLYSLQRVITLVAKARLESQAPTGEGATRAFKIRFNNSLHVPLFRELLFACRRRGDACVQNKI